MVMMMMMTELKHDYSIFPTQIIRCYFFFFSKSQVPLVRVKLCHLRCLMCMQYIYAIHIFQNVAIYIKYFAHICNALVTFYHTAYILDNLRLTVAVEKGRKEALVVEKRLGNGLYLNFLLFAKTYRSFLCKTATIPSQLA